MSSYIALLRKDPDSDYGVEFPDFPGCISAGKDLDEARTMAAEALELHIEGMLADGEPLPRPSGLEAIMADPANRETVALLVTVHDQVTETVHVDLDLPETTLREVDARASSRGLTRSEFLARVTLDALRKSA
jgi:predicted RNase H-like HicB family nuclease